MKTYTTWQGYIEKGKRLPSQVHVLLSSLQLFKENRLLAVIPKLPNAMLPEPEQLLQLLSLKLVDSSINRKTLAHLHKGGLEYVGELYLVVWPRRKGIAGKVYDLLSSLNLPHELDLAEVNWIPPYATKDFFWRMSQPLAFYIQDKPRGVPWVINWYNKFQYAGEMFQITRRRWNYGPGFSIDHFRGVIKSDMGMRAGLYCPKTWVSPADPPK